MQAEERHFFIPGELGKIEAIEHTAPNPVNAILIMCHPHPLYQGSMNHKIVSTLCRAFSSVGVTSYRFNYRGVGQSEGVYGEGLGESRDALSVVQAIQHLHPQKKLILGGFSFGGYIAYHIAAEAQVSHLILIAPSVSNFKMIDLPEPTMLSTFSIIQGDADEIVPYEEVMAWLHTRKESFTLFKFGGAGHFFHGKLLVLKETALGIGRLAGLF